MTAKTCNICHTSIPENAPGGFCPACILRDADEPSATAPNAPSIEELSAAFPKLEILCLIGHGGMGYVYQARQPELDRMVAIKILAPTLRSDPAFEERFAREARVLGKLQHPNIVTLYEHGESGGFFYLMMEYIDGVNLRQAMSAGRFTPEQALAIVPAICDALQSAHAQGIWHRDIKPENILLDRDGRVKIADFGIARILGDPMRNFTLTRTGGMLGSAAYMAPEQHEKPHDVDHRADIYSLGVVIYEMLTGELPLGRFPAPSAKSAVDARIDEIVLRTLEKEREMRQQSATEVKTDMQNAAVAPAAPTSSIVDFSSWKLVLAAVVFSLMGTAWQNAYGPDGVRGVTSVGFFSPWLICSSVSGGKIFVSFANSFSIIAMFLAGACWLRWFWWKRARKQDLASFLLVKGPGLALKVGCMWVSAVAFFLWAWMAVTGLYLCLGSLLTGRPYLDAPVWEFLLASVASGTVWTLYQALHFSSSIFSSKPSSTTPRRDQISPSPEVEMEHISRQQSAEEVKTDVEGAGANTELAKQTVGATTASPLARLPRSVLWPLGLLLVGGVFLWLAYIVGETISTKMDARRSIILWPDPFVPETIRGEAITIKALTSFGVASTALGFLSSFWMLFEMKRGWRPPAGRCLIISLSILPVTLLALIGGFVFLRDGGLFCLMKYGIGLIGFTGAFFLGSAILFSLIFGLVRPLKPTSPSRRDLSHAAFGIAICALMAGAIQAKRADGNWPYSNVMEDGMWFFDTESKLSDSELIQLLHHAAGPHANSYEVRANNGWVGATVLVPNLSSRKALKGDPGSVTHVEALYRRLWQLLPVENLRTSDPWRIEFLGWRGARWANFLLMEICGWVCLAALLAALAGGRRMFWFFGSGLVLFCTLAALPTRTLDFGSLKLVRDPPLPPFTPSEIPAVLDFNTPGKSVETVFDAASRGQMKILRQGMSKALIGTMDKGDDWTDFLNHHKWCRVSASTFNIESDRATVTAKKIGLHGEDAGEYQISVIFEAGLWKVDSLLDWTGKIGHNGPFTTQGRDTTRDSPSAAIRAILKAAQERNARVFQNGLSKSFRASLNKNGEKAENFGDFGRCTFVSANQLDSANAEVVVEANDGSGRRFTFSMVSEDGEWKLNDLGSKP